jgi:integrase
MDRAEKATHGVKGHMSKFVDEPQPMRARSVAWIIERFIADMNSPEMKPIGPSQLYTLRVIQRSMLGEKSAAKLRKTDVIDYCRELRQRLNHATVNQYLCYLGGALKYAGSAWDDCEDVTEAAIKAARPFLVKHNIIGKGMPRTRVPTDEEIEALLAYYAKPPTHGKARLIPMPEIIAFALASTRRIGEICRIRFDDLDWDRKDEHGNPTPMYMVRDLKHPKKKKGNHKWFPLFPELAEIIRRQPRRTENPEERVFPYNSKSCSASYTNAKKALGIQNLRFHDNRREAITRWIAKLDKNLRKVRMVSGHENTLILERTYDATDSATLYEDLRKLQQQEAPRA